MAPRLSARVTGIEASATLALAKRAAELREAGKDVLSFGLGEPDFDTPAPVRQAAKAAIDRGETHYTLNEGIEPLRRAIADRLAGEQGLRYDHRTEIVVTAGSKQAIANALLALVEPGVGVLVPVPYWGSYVDLVRLAGGIVQFAPARPDGRFHASVLELSRAADERTRVLILNSPNNPTGAVLSPGELDEIARFVLERDLFVVSDEIYGALVYGGARHASVAAALPAMRERTIVASGMSKSFAMTGWRIGYAAGPAPVVEAMARIQGHMTSNASSISQHAALAALREGGDAMTSMRDEFDRRRRRVVERISALHGVALEPPEGAFYVFPRIDGLFGRHTAGGRLVRDATTFCDALLDEQQVVVVPGGVFGDDACFRLSYAAAMENLERGCDRIERFCESLK